MQALLDIAATLVFALTGALAASRKQMDVIGGIWFAIITGVGGGTMRDLLIGAPVFWINSSGPIITCILVALVTHVTAPLMESRYRIILWFDAVGMALVAVVGAAKGMQYGLPAVICIVMGVITASVGGIIRDVLSQEPSIVLRKEIYVSAATLSASSYVVLAHLWGHGGWATAVAFGLGALMRLLALHYGWSMPVYRPREGRDVEIVHPSGEEDG